MAALDFVQLHCPPTDVFYMPEVFAVFDNLVKVGKVRFYGASVERVEEGLKAMEYPDLQSLQVVFNILRQRPAEEQSRGETKRLGGGCDGCGTLRLSLGAELHHCRSRRSGGQADTNAHDGTTSEEP